MDDVVPVTFEPPGVTVQVPVGATALQAALGAEVDIPAPCGGRGSCGKCAVRVVAGEPGPADEVERTALRDAPRDIRLACRLRVGGPLTLHPGVQAVTVRPAAAPVAGSIGGIVAAIDLGTTTISAATMERDGGRSLGRGSAPNPQRAFGADVATRMSAAIAGQESVLRNRAVAGIAAVLDDVLSAPGSAGTCGRLVIAGNTVMAHLALGESTRGLAAYPYEPAYSGSRVTTAGAFGLDLLPPDSQVVVLPAVSAFVGGDVIAGVLATDLDRPGGVRVLVDLGTNAEVVVSVDGALTVSSAAAGPAFEAAGLACGGPAAPGAVEAVVADDRGGFGVRMIGDGPPAWLCGSGALSLVAVLLDLGHLDPAGRMSESGPLSDRFHRRGEVVAFQVVGEAGGEPDVYLTQLDVRELQLAKAAVSAALTLTLAEAGVRWEAVGELLVAGAFGEGVGAGLLGRLGVVSPNLQVRVTGTGNSSLAGASLVALDASAERRAEAVASSARSLELALAPAFQRTFLERMSFPAR